MNNDKDNATLYAELKAERFMTDQISLLHEAEDLADGIHILLFHCCTGVPAAHAGGGGNKGTFTSPAG